MTKQARIAFVGAGGHATESLYPNIAHIPEFDLVAVCDLVEERAASAAHRFGARGYYTDVNKMLRDAAPDGVCVCGPPSMHHDVGLEVLSHGLPVFIEKPPATSLKGAQELVDTAASKGTWGMVAFMKRFAPSNMVAKEYAESPAFGALSSVTVMHASGPYDDYYRMLIFNGIHLIDLARFFGGDVEALSAFGYDGPNSTKAIAASFRFVGGVAGILNMNSSATWGDCFEQAYITGSRAGMLLDASKAVELMAGDRAFANPEGQHLFGWSSRYYVSGNMAGWWAGGHYTRGYWGELSQFAKALLGQAEPTPSLADGLANMRFIEAVMISLRENNRVVKLADVKA
jgi:myo-inositol 2-dehydrogenase/D-chiro-inositol 1-dehydrogenase